MITKRPSPKADHVLVTFQLPATIWAETVHLVGDFNDWSRHAHPLKRTESGNWEIVIELPAHRAYHFRYLVDGTSWQNDWNADRYVPNPFGGDNSVIDL
ncbi:MAG: isoamylase early set domain-containing protein [Chloroflexota bacterium]